MITEKEINTVEEDYKDIVVMFICIMILFGVMMFGHYFTDIEDKMEEVNHVYKKGDKVHYQPYHYPKDEWENGIVKKVNPQMDHSVFVVYKCGGLWDHYEDYTAALTNVRDLKPDWKESH